MHPIDKKARVAGAIYLCLALTAPFSQIYVPAKLIVRGNASVTAQKMAPDQRGQRSTPFPCAGVTNKTMESKSSNKLEPAQHRAAAVNAMIALRLLKGGDFLKGFEPVQLERPERAGAHDERGLYSSWPGLDCLYPSLPEISLLPRALVALGIFALLLLALVTLIIIVWPGLGALLGLGYLAPMFFYELGLGLWLIFKGLKAP